jgi:predicted transcriptional regulator
MADVEGVIRERIAELEAERTKLEAALAALTGRGQGSRQAKRRASPARSTSRRAGTRARPGQRRSQILGHLEKNPGARPSEIASSIGASSQQVSAVIRKLHAEKLVRKRGNGYGLSRAGQSATDSS